MLSSGLNIVDIQAMLAVMKFRISLLQFDVHFEKEHKMPENTDHLNFKGEHFHIIRYVNVC